MTNMISELKREAWTWLKPVQMIHLATWDSAHPRVRPVSLIFDEGRFWICTGTKEAKVTGWNTIPCRRRTGKPSRQSTKNWSAN